MEGNNILVHCMYGLGRSGIVGASLLVYDPEDAIRGIQHARRGLLILRNQQDF